MLLHPRDLSVRDTHKILTGTIVPRPIAWISTWGLDSGGKQIVNLAPFSYFNGAASKPALVTVAISNRDPAKDTLRNLRRHGEAAISIVPEQLRKQMDQSAAQYAPTESEAVRLSLQMVPVDGVSVPAVAESPVRFGCVVHRQIPLGDEVYGSTLVVFEVRSIWVDDAAVDDQLHVDVMQLAPVARLAGAGYASVHRPVVLQREPIA